MGGTMPPPQAGVYCISDIVGQIGANLRVDKHREQAQLSHRDRATLYVSAFMLFHEVWQLEKFQSAKVTFKVIQGHWHWCHLLGNIQCPISLLLQLCLYLA